ncbi:nuclear transport factor 2 family protein [Chloroflexi bacterium TSY]|nr:nuclear transport factor 2 family protein [Chloroflexi bacterium TSY]
MEDPELLLKRYFMAMNTGNSEDAVALFAEDAVRLDTATPDHQVIGKAQIAKGIAARINDNIHIEASDFEAQDNHARCLAKVWTDYGRRMGFAPVIETAQIVVKDRMIQRFTVTVTPESLNRIRDAEAEHLR